MNYYQHHIGDFDRATRHLSRLERSIYSDLIDVYYDTESPLTLDKSALCRKIIARSNDEATAVEQVLNEFFTETANGWYHYRCEEEIEAYRSSTSQKSIAGKASAAKRALKHHQAMNGIPTAVERPLDACSTIDEQTFNGTPTIHYPLSINHKPKDKVKPIVPASAETALPDWIPTDAWVAFCAMRKSIKKPITESAIPLAIAKLDKLRSAGNDPRAVLEQSTLNSWQGMFEVKTDNVAKQSSNYQTPNEKARSWGDQLTGKTKHEPNPNFDFIDINPAPEEMG